MVFFLMDIRLLVSTEELSPPSPCGSGAMRIGADAQISKKNANAASKGCLASTGDSEDMTVLLVLSLDGGHFTHFAAWATLHPFLLSLLFKTSALYPPPATNA